MTGADTPVEMQGCRQSLSSYLRVLRLQAPMPDRWTRFWNAVPCMQHKAGMEHPAWLIQLCWMSQHQHLEACARVFWSDQFGQADAEADAISAELSRMVQSGIASGGQAGEALQAGQVPDALVVQLLQ